VQDAGPNPNLNTNNPNRYPNPNPISSLTLTLANYKPNPKASLPAWSGIEKFRDESCVWSDFQHSTKNTQWKDNSLINKWY
jgi:hypothetical protein